MRRRIFTVVVIANVVVGMGVLGAGSAGAATRRSVASSPFLTSERPYLVPLAPGVQIRPILSTGDVIGGRQAGYQMSGVPDGIGWYASTDGSIEVFFNHELSALYDPSGARVSHVTLNADGAVVAASYPIDGTEGFEWFCSSTLRVIDGVPWYLTGEESKHSDRHGSSIALNASSGRYVETPQFGHFGHENVVPVDGLSKTYLGLSEDGFGESSQLYAYLADSFGGAIRGDGALRVWVPDEPVADGNPSPADIVKGETMAGHFVRIPRSASVLPRDLESMAQDLGAFDFNRIEDQTADPDEPGVVYFSETGAAKQETSHGRIYKLEVDPDNPRHATLAVVLSAAEGDDIFNPDNLGISHSSLVIQEDRNWKHSGYNRVLVYDLASGSLTPVARTDPSQDIIDAKGLGAWESSGVVDASAAFGQGWWFLNVQAHYSEVGVPDLSLKPDSATGEGGQLELVYIPGT
jgi:hypothetical protein